MRKLLLSVALLAGLTVRAGEIPLNFIHSEWPTPIDWSGTIDLTAEYGLIPGTDKARTLAQAGLTIDQAKTKFNRFYARWKAEGRTDTDFLKVGTFTAACLDAFWRGHLHDISSNPGGSGNIFIGPGVWWHNLQLYWTYGRVFGSGLFIHEPADTQISPWHEQWMGDPKMRNSLVSPSFGRNDLYGYHEGAYVTDIRFNGRKSSPWWDTSYESSGIVGWDLGEGSEIGRVKCDDYNDFGIHLVRSTPGYIHNLSAFTNNRAAVGMTGTALATVVVDLISGDDNCTLFDMLPGYGREAGGNLTVTAVKCESSTIGEGTLGTHHVWKGQSIAKLRGQFKAVFTNITHASSWTTTGQLFWIDNRLTNGTAQASKLIAGGKGFGYAASITDSYRKVYYDPPPNYTAWDLVYNCGTGFYQFNEVVQPPSKPYGGAGAMGFTRAGQSFNFATGTPQQQVSGTAPPPQPVSCTGWTAGTWSAWSTCVTGSQARTRTVTASPAGCTTTPPGVKPADTETQACTVTPPPTGGVIATVNNYSNPSNTIKTQAVNWVGGRVFTFTGIKSSANMNFKLICGLIDTDGIGRGLMIRPIAGTNQGQLFDNRVGANEAIVLAVINSATATNVTVTLSRPMDVKFLGSQSSSVGNSFLGSWTKLEVR